jgi:hypothetical protein
VAEWMEAEPREGTWQAWPRRACGLDRTECQSGYLITWAENEASIVQRVAVR